MNSYRLRHETDRQWLAGAVEHGATLGQRGPFLQVLRLAEAPEFLSAQHLQLESAPARDYKQDQEQNFRDAQAKSYFFK
jgi:hypothetical protein